MQLIANTQQKWRGHLSMSFNFKWLEVRTEKFSPFLISSTFGRVSISQMIFTHNLSIFRANLVQVKWFRAFDQKYRHLDVREIGRPGWEIDDIMRGGSTEATLHWWARDDNHASIIAAPIWNLNGIHFVKFLLTTGINRWCRENSMKKYILQKQKSTYCCI